MAETIMTDTKAIEQIVQQLEDAWNVGDGDAFAEPFYKQADFTVWNGMVQKGRRAIAEGHNQIFSTIYIGSQSKIEIVWLRFLTPNVAVCQLKSGMVKDPTRFLAQTPVRSSWPSMKPLLVLRKQDQVWRIEVFQNTPIIEMPVPSNSGVRP